MLDLDRARVVKKVQLHGGGAFTLVPVNPDYERERFTPEDADTGTYRSELSGLATRVRVVGKVVWYPTLA